MHMPDRVCCPVCRYDLKDVPGSRCPECGSEFELKAYVKPEAVGTGLLQLVAFMLLVATIAIVIRLETGWALSAWMSPLSAFIVFVGAPMIATIVFGIGGSLRAMRSLAIPTSEPGVSADAVGFFRLLAALAFGMGSIAMIVGVAHVFGMLASADLGAIGHGVASALLSQLYALMLAVPAVAASALLARRGDASGERRADAGRSALMIAGGAEVATAAAVIVVGVVLFAMQR